MTKPEGPFTPSKLSAIAQTRNIASKTTTKNSLLGPFLLSPSNKGDLLGRITNHVELNTSLGLSNFPRPGFIFRRYNNLNFLFFPFRRIFHGDIFFHGERANNCGNHSQICARIESVLWKLSRSYLHSARLSAAVSYPYYHAGCSLVASGLCAPIQTIHPSDICLGLRLIARVPLGGGGLGVGWSNYSATLWELSTEFHSFSVCYSRRYASEVLDSSIVCLGTKNPKQSAPAAVN